MNAHRTLLIVSLFFLAAPAFAETPPAAPVAAVDAKVEPVAVPAKPEPASLKIDVGQAKLNVLLQTWYISDSTATTLGRNNFRARRAEIKLGGTLSPEAKWLVMIDPAKSLRTGPVAATNDNKVLQDLVLSYSLWNSLELTTGQFKTPTVAEALESSGDLTLPERSMIARALGDKRQLGFQAAYKEAKWKLTAMLSNGGSANTDDPNNAKDLNVRADFFPFEGFSLGGWAGATDGEFGKNGKWGFNLRWKGESEFARFEQASSDTTNVTGVKTKSNGYVAEVGYSVLKNLQPVLRFERYYPDSASTDNGKATTFGLNYYLSKNNQKLQLSHAWMERVKGTSGSYVTDLGMGAGRLLLLSFQMAI